MSLASCDVDRQRSVLSLLVQVRAVPQQQTTQLGVAEDGRHVKRRITGDVRPSRLCSASQQQLRHAVVGTPDGVVERSSTFVVLDVDVGVQLKQRVDGHVETSTYGNQQRGLATPLTLQPSTTSHTLLATGLCFKPGFRHPGTYQKKPRWVFWVHPPKNPPQKNPHFYFNLILVYTLCATNNAIFYCF